MQSLINWDKTITIFNQGEEITPSIPRHYVDNEIEGKVKLKYFKPIFQSLDEFVSNSFRQSFKIVNTDIGKQACLVKEWFYQNSKLEFWVNNEGWAAIYGTTDTFLIIGNFVDHPFVQTPLFTFCNSDGSTSDQDDFITFNLDDVKSLMKSKVPEYIFNQIH